MPGPTDFAPFPPLILARQIPGDMAPGSLCPRLVSELCPLIVQGWAPTRVTSLKGFPARLFFNRCLRQAMKVIFAASAFSFTALWLLGGVLLCFSTASFYGLIVAAFCLNDCLIIFCLYSFMNHRYGKQPQGASQNS